MTVGDDLASKARRLVELRDRRDEDKARLKESEAEYRQFEQEFFQALDESPLRGAQKIDLGDDLGEITFTPRQTYYGRILDVDKAYEYFESRAMADEMFHPQVSKRRLNELVNTCLEGHTPLPDGIDYYSVNRIAITRPRQT